MSQLQVVAINHLLRWRWPLAIVWLVLALVGGALLKPPPAQRSMDRLFDSRDGDLRAYQQALEIFGPAEPILVVYEDTRLFSEDDSGLERVGELTRFLQQLPGVVETVSLSKLDELVGETLGGSITDGSFFSERLLTVLQGFTHSSDRRTIAVARWGSG